MKSPSSRVRSARKLRAEVLAKVARYQREAIDDWPLCGWGREAKDEAPRCTRRCSPTEPGCVIDHIAGGGNLHRKRRGGTAKNAEATWRDIRDGALGGEIERFRVLCPVHAAEDARRRTVQYWTKMGRIANKVALELERCGVYASPQEALRELIREQRRKAKRGRRRTATRRARNPSDRVVAAIGS